MPRFRLTVEYDGAPFVGWQRQENGPSVQQALEEALFRFCGERATVHGAGRTDAGVHAMAQVAHVDLQRDASPRTVRDAVNFHLKPAPVAVLEVQPATPDFHARFSATGRAWWVPVALDAEGMAAAARLLLGRHDFTSFRSGECQAENPVRTLDALSVVCDGAEIVIEARARSFLHNQVRIIAGTLKQVGEGRRTSEQVAAALAARDRATAGPTAPPHGLYLIEVRY